LCSFSPPYFENLVEVLSSSHLLCFTNDGITLLKSRTCQNIDICLGSPAVFEILVVIKTRGFPSLLCSSFGFYICNKLIIKQSKVVKKKIKKCYK